MMLLTAEAAGGLSWVDRMILEVWCSSHGIPLDHTIEVRAPSSRTGWGEILVYKTNDDGKHYAVEPLGDAVTEVFAFPGMRPFPTRVARVARPVG